MSLNWSEYGLRDLPFETYSHDYEMAGRKSEWENLSTRIERYLIRGGCQFIILLGAYGQGKTYTITRVYKKFTDTENDFPKTLVVRTIKGSPIRAREAEARHSLFALDLVFRVFANIGYAKLREISLTMDRKESMKIKRRDSRKLFTALGSDNEELAESAFLLLTGDAQSEDTKSVGIGRMISTSPRALKIFYDFLRLIKIAPYEHMLILLDEFEYIINIESKTRITRILTTFRSMFDDIGGMYDDENDDISSLTFVFAITPEGWATLVTLDEDAKEKTGGGVAPFIQRLRRDSYVTLQPFSLNDTKELIKIRLKKHRIVNYDKSDDYYPFKEAAIKTLYEKGNANPRLILQLAGIVLEDSLIDGLKKITAKDVIKIINKYPIPSYQRNDEAG